LTAFNHCNDNSLQVNHQPGKHCLLLVLLSLVKVNGSGASNIVVTMDALELHPNAT
jgi:hypothetical protein